MPKTLPRPRFLPCRDRKSTRLNSSHLGISYAVFCLKKKKTNATRSGNNLIAEKAESHDAAATPLTIATMIELYARSRMPGHLRTSNEIESSLKSAHNT